MPRVAQETEGDPLIADCFIETMKAEDMRGLIVTIDEDGKATLRSCGLSELELAHVAAVMADGCLEIATAASDSRH